MLRCTQAVGGAASQCRLAGRCHIPMGTTAPVSGSPLPPSVIVRKGPEAAPALGETCDGMPPPWRSGTDAVLKSGAGASKWTFDLRLWRWQRSGIDGSAVVEIGTSVRDKHALAARRWGDGRDGLAAAVKRARLDGGEAASPPPPQHAAVRHNLSSPR